MNDKDEFINKKNLLQEFANEIYKFDSVNGEFQRGVDWALRMIVKHPTVDVEKVRHGEWVKIRYQVYECSCCKRSVYLEGLNVTDENETKLLRELYPYCHCGCKMNKRGRKINDI